MKIRIDSTMAGVIDSMRPSRADIIKRAITLMTVVVNAKKAGNTVVIVAKDGTERKLIV